MPDRILGPPNTNQVLPNSLSSWIGWFEELFAKPNQLRARETGYCDLRDFSDRLAEIGGYITSSKHQRSAIFKKYYAKYFAWFCGVAASAHLNLEEYIWMRFPDKCPYCGERPCVYLYNPGLRVHKLENHEQQLESIRCEAEEALREDPSLATRSLSHWFEHFMRIYPSNLHGSVGDIVERLHEEQSELLKEIRKANRLRDASGNIVDDTSREKVLEEMSDLLSWFLALGAKLAITLGGENYPTLREANGHALMVDFDMAIYQSFRDGCHKCHRWPCDCEADVAIDRSDLKLVTDRGDGEMRKDVALRWLLETKKVDLREFKVVGDYVVADEERRIALAKKVSTLKRRFTHPRRGKPFSVLLCGASGSGKTFFASQVAKELEMEFERVNFASCRDIEKRLHEFFVDVKEKGEGRAILLDEFDIVDHDGQTIYRFLLVPLGSGKAEVLKKPLTLPRFLWFFAGSRSRTISDFEEYLSDNCIERGPDCLRRFDMLLEFPLPIEPIDIAVMACSIAKGKLPNLSNIDTMLLFYLSITEWKDCGDIEKAVEEVCEACPNGYLQFDMLPNLAEVTSKYLDAYSYLAKKRILVS